MRVFISGGAGFIGSHLAEFFLQQGFAVKAYDNLSLGKKELLKKVIDHKNFEFVEADLLDLPRLKNEMAGFDLVYHMAANSDISQGALHTDIDLKNGTIATYNVLEAMRVNKVKQMVFASTSAIYGEASIKPTPENYGPLLPISFYGASKLACEGLCTAFSHNYDIKVWAYRFANIVGPHSTHGVIYDFTHRLLAEPNVLKVLGNGTQRKSYLHVQDCIAGMWFGYKNSHEPFQIFNLASYGVTNVAKIAEKVVARVAKQTGVKARIEFGEGERGWKGDVPYTHLEGAQLEKLGWKAKLESDQAVELAIDQIVQEILEAKK